MYITSIRIQNYKSFLDSGDIPLAKGFNVIVGANNAGKTSLVESLNFREQRIFRFPIPHLSQFISPVSVNKDSLIEFTIELSGQELQKKLYSRQLSDKRFTNFIFPYLKEIGITPKDSLAEIFEKKIITAKYVYSFLHDRFEFLYSPQHDIFSLNDNLDTVIFKFGEMEEIEVIKSSRFKTDEAKRNTIFNSITETIIGLIYYIKSERFNFSSSKYTNNYVSPSDITQLPTLLRLLQDNPKRWNTYQETIKEVLPEIEKITIPEGEIPIADDPTKTTRQVYIKIWSKEAVDTEREDLAFPLRNSGTGVGQILALLYVVIESKLPRILILEEPQSFLHPRALRKLFEILKQYPQHQYIITTHSPTVITAADPDNILLVEKIGSESTVTPISRQQKQDMTRVLESVGASLSDIFGADYVLWVEGQTEEQCFPLIIRKLCKHKDKLLDTEILRVRSTGDFEEKPQSKVDLVFDTYELLSKGNALRPPTIGFIFDKEKRSEKQRNHWMEKSKGMMAFLEKCMYENYLLHSGAIAAILSRDTNSSISSDQIDAWFIKNAVNLDDVDLNAVEQLQKLFNELGNCNYKKNKVAYGYDLTKWILENEPTHLQKLADFLDEQIEIWTNKPQA